jgi:hypothetical protein
MSSGFQSELRDALDEPLREMRDTMNTMTGGFDDGGAPTQATPSAGPRLTPDGAVVEPEAAPGTATDDPTVADPAMAPVTPPEAPAAAAPPNGTPPAAGNGSNGANGTGATSAAVPADEPVVPAEPD